MRLALSAPPPTDVVARLVEGAVASRAAGRWADAVRAARPLVGEIEALRETLRVAGITRVVAATAGGAGVAAEAIAAGEPRLVVLDTPDPAQTADALAGDLDATMLVVSVPPGADRAAVDLVVAVVRRAFRAEGLDPAGRTVLVAAPGDTAAEHTASGHPAPGGPFVVAAPAGSPSALSAYALVPAGLAGADVGAVQADAAAVADELAADSPANPALMLGALLAGAETVALAGSGPAAWVAQLLADTAWSGTGWSGTGWSGTAPLPVVVEGDGAPDWTGPGVLAVGVGEELPDADVAALGAPAAQILLWQHAAAVAAHLTGRATEPGAGAVAPPADDPAFAEGAVAVHAGPWLPAGTATVADAVSAFVASRPATGPGPAHLALHAYLDRESDASVAVLRAELSRRTGLTTTFDWAPRGPRATAEGALVCQLTGDPDDADPELDGLRALQQRMARTDAGELARRGHPVLRLHLADRLAGLVGVVRAAQRL